MAKYIFAYHGGSAPENPEDQARVMADWMAWIGAHDGSWVDSGAPVGESTTVHSDGSVTPDGGANPLSGYAFVTADSLQAATEIAQGCPILKDGGSVEIASVHEM